MKSSKPESFMDGLQREELFRFERLFQGALLHLVPGPLFSFTSSFLRDAVISNRGLSQWNRNLFEENFCFRVSDGNPLEEEFCLHVPGVIVESISRKNFVLLVLVLE